MIKKFVKIFIITFIALLTLMVTPTFAKEISLEGTAGTSKLENEIKAVCQENEPTFIYIIGKYGFTSLHDITMQDIMLASRSIEVTNTEDLDALKKELAINMISRGFNLETGDLEGWKIDDNEVGTAKLAEIFDLKYIDYVELKEIDAEYVNDLVKEAIPNINTKYFNEINLDGNTIKAEVADRSQKILDIEGSNIVTEINRILNDSNVKAIKMNFEGITEPLIIENYNDQSKGKAFEWIGNHLSEIISNANDIDSLVLGDLAGLNFDITIKLVEGLTTTDGKNEIEYQVALNANPVTVTFNADNGEATTSQTIETRTVAVPTEPIKNGYKFMGWYLENTETKFDFNQTITENITLVAHWEINVDEKMENIISSSNDKNKEKFSIKFAENSEDTLYFTPVDTSRTLTSIMGTGLSSALVEELSKGEIEEITVTYGNNAPVEIPAGAKTGDVLDAMLEVLSQITGRTWLENLSKPLSELELIGKNVTVNVILNPEKIKDQELNKEYTVIFAE